MTLLLPSVSKPNWITQYVGHVKIILTGSKTCAQIRSERNQKFVRAPFLLPVKVVFTCSFQNKA